MAQYLNFEAEAEFIDERKPRLKKVKNTYEYLL